MNISCVSEQGKQRDTKYMGKTQGSADMAYGSCAYGKPHCRLQRHLGYASRGGEAAGGFGIETAGYESACARRENGGG